MLSSLTFTTPLVLAALGLLPVLWWLLRIMPPRPGHVTFPPVIFLLGLKDREETPHHTPLWLLILRLVLAALIIIGLAGPVLNPPPKLTGNGPLVMVIDDGWAAASTWSRRMDLARQTIDQAARDGRPVALITTAQAPGQHRAQTLMGARQARTELDKLSPHPFATARQETAHALAKAWPDALARTSSDFILLLDALEDTGLKGAQLLSDTLASHGRVFSLEASGLQDPLALAPPTRSGAVFQIKVVRPSPGAGRTGQVRAIDGAGRSLGDAPFTFIEGATETMASLTLPLELQNTITRMEIPGERSAGATTLLDERWQRRTVGLATAGTGDIDRPLLSDVFYIDRALAPFADVRQGDLDTFFGQTAPPPLSALVLPDIGQLSETKQEAVRKWIEDGGMLIRFAGPRLALRQDFSVPVPLRQGGRALGGALSWNEPQKLAPFSETSPFHGLHIPADVTVSKQVLAEPSIDLANNTWARLSDGTPLVTAQRRGQGWTVLFHITANPDWSTLPMSGLFVEMLERTLAWSKANTAQPPDPSQTGPGLLYANKVLNGFGELVSAPATLNAIAYDDLASWIPGAKTPPGLYQRPAMTRALNLTGPETVLAPLPKLPAHVAVLAPGDALAIALGPIALTGALLLALLDAVVVLFLGQTGTGSAGLKGLWKKSSALAFVLALFLVNPSPSHGATTASDEEALRATLKTHLAYVITGDQQTDHLSRRGLAGLSQVIGARTAVEPGDPIGIHLATDELAFFPVIYWPVSAAHTAPQPKALERLGRYMRTGGTVIFDTRDQELHFSGLKGAGPLTANTKRLREILTSLDIPPLTIVPDDHVLTKSFYLLREFPGRWQGGKVWVEAVTDEAGAHAGGSLNDGVSSVIIGANDWAAAWAVDEFGRPLAVTVPGGMRQRELARRFGINIVMYTLTGNYKADQVHVPALLERLGQ